MDRIHATQPYANIVLNLSNYGDRVPSACIDCRSAVSLRITQTFVVTALDSGMLEISVTLTDNSVRSAVRSFGAVHTNSGVTTPTYHFVSSVTCWCPSAVSCWCPGAVS